MGCHSFSNESGSVRGTICLRDIYKFQGFTFEYHSYLGATPVKKKSFIGRKTIPPGFWKMIRDFEKLPDKEDYLVHG